MAGTAGLPLRWHLIGHLQSNKARKAAEHFDVIHSVDTVAAPDDARRGGAGRRSSPSNLLVQVDLAGEATKHGARPTRSAAFSTAGRECRAVRSAGPDDDPSGGRRTRSRPPVLCRPSRACATICWPRASIPRCFDELSMGMSHDFEVAIEEGATLVRVGSAIFGERHHV